MDVFAIAITAVLVFAAGVVAGGLYYRKAVAEEKLLKDHISAEVRTMRLSINTIFEELARKFGKTF